MVFASLEAVILSVLEKPWQHACECSSLKINRSNIYYSIQHTQAFILVAGNDLIIGSIFFSFSLCGKLWLGWNKIFILLSLIRKHQIYVQRFFLSRDYRLSNLFWVILWVFANLSCQMGCFLDLLNCTYSAGKESIGSVNGRQNLKCDVTNLLSVIFRWTNQIFHRRFSQEAKDWGFLLVVSHCEQKV